ncbi:MAG: UvrD-helicase domain-containing protein, partial [Erysipelotrichaceae bacterium]|nr:UvrD-helicase domain-containing protein [Erysipelotrichaceae bacterium]
MEKNRKKLKFTADQTRAYTHDGKDLIVAASAGAGKTAVLIEYIFNKVGKERNGEKTSISDILAMTFTEAAASSMKKKLFERMNEELSEEEINDGYDGEWLKKEAELLPSADICTIDSFCTNILSQYCYVIGWDPERPKTILDANTVAELKREVAHEIVVEYCKRNELFYELSAFYSNNGNHTGNIENLLISVSDEIDRYADEEKWYRTVADHYEAKTFDELSQENKDIFFMTVKENLELMKDTLEEYLKLISNDLHLGEQ